MVGSTPRPEDRDSTDSAGPDDRVDSSPPDDDAATADHVLDGNPEDDVLPASPRRRRMAGTLALLLVAAIIVFLVWFVSTHTEQAEPGALFSASDPPHAFRSGVA